MDIKIQAPSQFAIKHIHLPHSKSIANRLLILNRLADFTTDIPNLPEASDVKEMQQALQETSPIVFAGSGASTYRFLTALFSIERGTRQLNASEQMMQRPVGPLVDGLLSLGARIRYMGKKGFPPLLIGGKSLEGGKIEIDASESSQYISALLMIAPKLKKGLQLTFKNKPVSAPYIELTIKLMEQMGIAVTRLDNGWIVHHQEYKYEDIAIEGDWSAAPYFYNLLAFAGRGDFTLLPLSFDSLQADQRIMDIMSDLGFIHHQKLRGIRIVPGLLNKQEVTLDLRHTPDLFPALAALYAGLGIEATFTGIVHLKTKESDRLAAMKLELDKFGIDATYDRDTWHQKSNDALINPLKVSSHGDHRIAMALASLCIKTGSFYIANAGVVDKSFPAYWETLKDIGFTIT